MKARLSALASRRSQLIARAEEQRHDMALHYSHIEPSLHVVDTGWRLARKIREHPILFSVGTALFFRFVRGRLGFVQKLSTWTNRLTMGWQIFSRVRSAFSQPR